MGGRRVFFSNGLRALELLGTRVSDVEIDGSEYIHSTIIIAIVSCLL